ncbi:S-adenosyl-L-methionine-dependent methyltransferase [Pilobolus umbonatus]|nr:S-adenosyl-L-methionine-dependent methyltransferase [Pilobolus umbonatus]
MGNQTSKVIATSKKRRDRNRRRSLNTIHSHDGPYSISSNGNNDWSDTQSYKRSSEETLEAAVNAAEAMKNNISKQHLSSPPNAPRRKSISEFFSRRKQSLVALHPTNVAEDMKESDRLQRQHYLLKSSRKSNTVAPIDSPKVIIESGTGNGIWALEMAAEHKSSQIIGIDIKPPAYNISCPPNLCFNQSDITESWPMNNNSVDFIFQRNMYLCIMKEQWPKVLAEMFRVIKPGGYIELVETELWSHNPGPVQKAFISFYKDQCVSLNVDLDVDESIGTCLEETGFVDIEKTYIDIPIGEWPADSESRKYGFINKEIQKAMLKNKKHSYVPKWGISPNDYDVAVSEVLDEYEEFHSFSRFICWIAKKPLE